ncbi:hypothetical protein FB451DRAFT_1569166 [Mycena latifolia]|nr:hypothetical protein FB451DRAFT_1569166 [Mycena latifolia]
MSSLFTSKLGTNYCPQDEEIAQIQTLLVEPTLRLKCLDDEIATLQKALDKLAEERAEICAYVDAHKALISPVQRLPLDVIKEIFVACLPTHRNCVMSAVEAPVLLGCICSSWRSISLSTPHLWSRLHIVEPPCSYNSAAAFKEKAVQRLEITKIWLGRSGRYPLSISLLSPFDSFTSPTQNPLIRDLLPFTSRWEHISFTAMFSSLMTMIHLKPADVPMLKSVTIKELHEPIDAPGRYNSTGFLHGPKISSFNFEGSSFSPLELPLRWDSLTDLSIAEKWGSEPPFMTNEMTLQVLSRCPQLRTCRILVCDPPGTLNSSRIGEPVLELSFLHTLDLDCDTFTAAAYCLFGRLSLPQLRNLKLHGMSDTADTPYALLLTTKHIEKLDITIELFPKPFLANFLHELPPTLRELKISKFLESRRNVTFDDEILDSFSPSADIPTPCCPGLQELEMEYSCSASDKALLRFIRSWALRRVVICFDRVMELDIRPELEPLVKNGLHLALTYHASRVSFSPWIGLGDAPNFLQAP